MPSIGYCLHLPSMVTVCRLWGFSGGNRDVIRNGDIFWINNNWEETRFHFVTFVQFRTPNRGKVEWCLHWNWNKLVALSRLLIPCFYLNHFSEKGLTTKWFMLVGPFKYVAPQYCSPCATDLQRSIFVLISYSEASLSLVKNGQRTLWSCSRC